MTHSTLVEKYIAARYDWFEMEAEIETEEDVVVRDVVVFFEVDYSDHHPDSATVCYIIDPIADDEIDCEYLKADAEKMLHSGKYR